MREVDPELLKAFHMMWDHFPEPCRLIHRSREVVAMNPPCAAIPREVGSICAQEPPLEKHRGCRAGEALETHRAQTLYGRRADGTEATAYWLPVDGYPDFYVHFAIRWTRAPE